MSKPGRKLKIQMQISIDGSVSTGPNDDQSWVTWALDEIYKNVLDLLDSIDIIIIGRKLAVDYIPFWQNTYTKPTDPMFGFAQRIVGAQKVVFTKTLEKSIWANTELAKGNLIDEVEDLKNGKGKDIIAYGGATFVSYLIKNNLIDEYFLFVNPAAIGNGMSIFSKLDGKQSLKVIKSIGFDCGITLLNYQR